MKNVFFNLSKLVFNEWKENKTNTFSQERKIIHKHFSNPHSVIFNFYNGKYFFEYSYEVI